VQVIGIQHHYAKCKSVEDIHSVELELDQLAAAVECIRRDVSSQVMFKTSIEMVWGQDPLAKLASDIMHMDKAN
jgi:hypothetical protein